jgi:resuscitation-promoting factor RpfB
MMKSKLTYLALGLGLLTLAAWLLASKTVTLVVDGQEQVLRTYAWRVDQLLAEAGLPVHPGDQLHPPMGTWLLGDATVRLERAARVVILADGESVQIDSSERSPKELLAQAGLSLSGADSLLSNGEPLSEDEPIPAGVSHLLEVHRGVPVIVVDGTITHSFSSTAATLGAALWEAGIRLHAADRLSPPPHTPLNLPQASANLKMRPKLEAAIIRAKAYTIRSGEQGLPVRSAAATVGELLAESGHAPQGLDYSIPAATEPLTDLKEVRVVRVRESVMIEQAPLPFETLREPLPELELDKQQVVHPGQAGILASRVRVRYEDGEEVSRQVEGEWVARLPEDRLIGYGTLPVMHTLDTPDGPVQYYRALQMYATSYHPSTTSSTTASGLPLQKGVATVDRRYILFNTRMYVPGYGHALAADTGAGVQGRMIDLGYSDHDYVPWSRWVTVYFLWPPPEVIPWIGP